MSAVVTIASWCSSSVPPHLLVAVEALAVVSLGGVYWNNVDVWVLKGLLCSYEAIVIIAASLFSIVVNYNTESLSKTPAHPSLTGTIIDSCAFACLAILFVASDCLNVRSIWFRKFCFLLFMVFVVTNLVISQLLPNRSIKVAVLGYVHSQKLLFSCYLQIITMALPALYCVMTDCNQEKIALLRCSMLRPPLAKQQTTDKMMRGRFEHGHGFVGFDF